MKRCEVFEKSYTTEEIKDSGSLALQEEWVEQFKVDDFLNDLEDSIKDAYDLLESIHSVGELDRVQDCMDKLGELKDILY